MIILLARQHITCAQVLIACKLRHMGAVLMVASKSCILVRIKKAVNCGGFSFILWTEISRIRGQVFKKTRRLHLWKNGMKLEGRTLTWKYVRTGWYSGVMASSVGCNLSFCSSLFWPCVRFSVRDPEVAKGLQLQSELPNLMGT